MKVISTKLDGSALIELDNLCQHTNVVGVSEPIRMSANIKDIPDLLRIGQNARRAAQKLHSLMMENQVPVRVVLRGN